jgi:ribosome-associated protein
MSPVKAKENLKKQVLKDSLEKAQVAALSVLDTKGIDLIVLEMIGLVSFTDYFVICSGTSAPHVSAIVDSVEDALRLQGVKPRSIEGKRASHWALMDYGDVVVHVFDTASREYYELEKLWLDAKRIEVNEDTSVVGGKDQGELDS